MNSMQQPPLGVLGLMSGTSCDGVDALAVRLELTEGGLVWEVLDRASRAYPPDLRARLLATLDPATSDVATITQLHTEIGDFCADLAETLGSYDLVALSGQTVFHIPRPDAARGWHTRSTLQLGEPARVAERVGRPVYSGFRQSDMAAGGQGAPLVAFADLKLFHEPGRAMAVHNLGGISNLTYVPADGDPAGVVAFDTGPGNCLLDEAASYYFGLEYDASGALAARGQVHEDVLGVLLTHPYYALPYPKTTGREVFSLAACRDALAGLSGVDALATLTALTAETVARAYRPLGDLRRVVVAGGGAYNATLMDALRVRLNAARGAETGVEVEALAFRGASARDREALCFAVLGYYAHYDLPNTLPHVTGARHAVVAGSWTGGVTP